LVESRRQYSDNGKKAPGPAMIIRNLWDILYLHANLQPHPQCFDFERKENKLELKMIKVKKTVKKN